MIHRTLAAFVCSTLWVACASHPATPIREPISASPASTTRALTQPPQGAKSVVTVSDDIRWACGIDEVDAHFDFDSAQLHRGDYPTLGKVANCFSRGPLSKAQLRIVGHTDPRGDSEYNLVLGSRRADTVSRYLADEGLRSDRMGTVSLGEYEAKGTDEASWSADRRVDLVLAQ